MLLNVNYISPLVGKNQHRLYNTVHHWWVRLHRLLLQPVFLVSANFSQFDLQMCLTNNIRSEVRGGGKESLFIGSELISITPISVVPAPLPLSVTQSSETDWLSLAVSAEMPANAAHRTNTPTANFYSSTSLFIRLLSIELLMSSV